MAAAAETGGAVRKKGGVILDVASVPRPHRANFDVSRGGVGVQVDPGISETIPRGMKPAPRRVSADEAGTEGAVSECALKHSPRGYRVVHHEAAEEGVLKAATDAGSTISVGCTQGVVDATHGRPLGED